MSGKLLKVIFLAAVMTLVFAFGAWAKPVEPSDALKVAENWIDYVVKNDGSWGAYKTAEAEKIEPFFVNGTLVGFVIDVAPMGFVLVPADDELPPVKAYSTDSIFNAESQGFEEWVGEELNKIVLILRDESASKLQFFPVNATKWDWLREKYSRETLPLVAAVPPPALLTTLWDQTDPYNRFCPEWNGEVCPVGCVATAAAQIMRYWSWPPQGTGSHSYTSQTHRFKLTVDFNHPYNWSLMPNSCSKFSGASEEEKNEVAKLGYEVAVAVNMDFDPQGSGTHTNDAYDALKTYFYYSNETTYEQFPGSDDVWFNTFKTDLDLGKPCLLGIQGSYGGHEVVVDGYRIDQGNMLHLNMGWSGSGNTYYALNNITGFEDESWQDCVHSIMPTEVQPADVAAAASPMGGTAPVTVSFAGQGKKGVGPYTYSWNFGDGSTGEGQSPTHIYEQAGAYGVTLTVTDTLSQTATDSHLTINVTGGTGVSAAASANVTSGEVPLTVVFTGVAQGGTSPYTYTWNFGDGSSEATSNTSISHTYTVSGTYTAILTVTDSKGAQATASGVAISAQPATPKPTIQLVTKLASPFRLRVTGTNFIQGSTVKINGTAVSQTLFKNSTKLVAKGANLKTLCPKGVTVQVTVENEPGNVSDPVNFTK